MQGDPDGGYVGAAFKKAIFDADDSRPVTANSEDTPGPCRPTHLRSLPARRMVAVYC